MTRSFQRPATATPFWKDGCPFSFLAINMRILAKQRGRYCKLEREGPCCRMLPSLLSCAFRCLHTPLVFLEQSATIVAIASLLVLASVLDVFPWPWVLCCPRVHLLPSAGLLRGAPLCNCVVSVPPFNLFCYLSTWNASAPLYLYIGVVNCVPHNCLCHIVSTLFLPIGLYRPNCPFKGRDSSHGTSQSATCLATPLKGPPCYFCFLHFERQAIASGFSSYRSTLVAELFAPELYYNTTLSPRTPTTSPTSIPCATFPTSLTITSPGLSLQLALQIRPGLRHHLPRLSGLCQRPGRPVCLRQLMAQRLFRARLAWRCRRTRTSLCSRTDLRTTGSGDNGSAFTGASWSCRTSRRRLC